MIPNAFGTSLVPERWWLRINLVPAYGGRVVPKDGISRCFNRHTLKRKC